MDYYKLLDIKDNASKHDIKRAYHKFALKYHPDKNKASDAEEKFRAIKEAYQILKDDQKRELYDRFDLPQARSARRSQHGRHHADHQRPRHSEEFFTGVSEKYSKEKSDQDELERIRRINTDILDKANAELRRKSDHHSSSSGRHKRASRAGVFMGNILAEENDDDYEKIVLDRLRKLSSQ